MPTDYCGRYAWTQGPIRQKNSDGSTKYSFKQYFPRDFNLVALSGNIGALRDVDGPIAAKSNVNINYFNLNILKREEIALLAGAQVGLASGTVNGSVQYGSRYNDVSVTFVDATRPTAATSPSLVEFDAARAQLIDMSNSIRDHYDVNGSTAKAYSGITFEGTDPELNVFNIFASALAGITSYTFKVPTKSAVIVTVLGSAPSPVFKNVGFRQYPPEKILWNFPDATWLTLDGVGFPGSILAPKATADFRNGSISGTVVVASADNANVEFYHTPFQLGCTGGLCLDKTWSCSDGTVMTDAGTAANVVSEAGFIEIKGGPYTSEGQIRTSPTNRVWYSFHPATSGRKNRPLVVFFNGGPGSATTPYLFSLNTGPTTLDPQVTSSYASNPNSWTSFANLLYIDAPATGFSYPLKDADGSMPDIGTDIDRDASNFLRVIVRFLLRHPDIKTNRVILAGESYGGIRATLMLKQLYGVTTSFTDTNSYQDAELKADLDSYFGDVLGTTNPSASQIATKFGHQVLIEPALVGQEQNDEFYTIKTNPPDYIPVYGLDAGYPISNCRPPYPDALDPSQKLCWRARSPVSSVFGDQGRQPSCDTFDCSKPNLWSETLGKQAATKLTQIGTLSKALNVNVKSIAWMYASKRTRAYGRVSTADYLVEIATPIDMAQDVGANGNGGFGALNSDDNYLAISNGKVHSSYGWVPSGSKTPTTPPEARTFNSDGMGAITGSAFAKHVLNGVVSFITVSKYDAAVWTPSIRDALLVLHPSPLVATGSSAVYDASLPNGLNRPGLMALYYDGGALRFVTMPTIYNSGHMIASRAPAELLADVRSWYSSN